MTDLSIIVYEIVQILAYEGNIRKVEISQRALEGAFLALEVSFRDRGGININKSNTE